MAEKLTIGVVYGGRSGEYEVSLRSAAAVYRHLNKEKYNTILIGISKEGRWYLQEKPQGGIPESLAVVSGNEMEASLIPGRGLSVKNTIVHLDIVLPVLHGSFGEDGCLQGALETAGIPYAASGVLGSALGMDKAAVKKIWEYHKLPVIPCRVIKKHQFNRGTTEFETLLDDIFSEFSPPLFVKPNCAGSSLGVNKIVSRDECYDALDDAFKYDRTVLIEKGVTGMEIECAVLGGYPPVASIPGRIAPLHDFYDYQAKYIDPKGAELIIPADIDDDVSRQIRDIAVRAFQTAEAEGFARVDLFLEEGTGKIFLNEINTIPGFTSISMFPLLFKATGKDFETLLDDIISLAVLREEERKDIIYSYEV